MRAFHRAGMRLQRRGAPPSARLAPPLHAPATAAAGLIEGACGMRQCKFVAFSARYPGKKRTAQKQPPSCVNLNHRSDGPSPKRASLRQKRHQKHAGEARGQVRRARTNGDRRPDDLAHRLRLSTLRNQTVSNCPIFVLGSKFCLNCNSIDAT